MTSHSTLAKSSIRSFAFTLAEVLITLGIIGIVAAMTLPALITKNQNKALEAGLKKNYSVLMQALEMYQAEYGEKLKPEDTGNQEAANSLPELLKPYLAVLYDCGTSHINKCMPLPEGIDSTDTSRSHIYKTFNNNALASNILDDGMFVLNDGSLILIENAKDINQKDRYISVDVNGHKKRPNKWGYDLFTFQLMNDGRLLPMGAPETVYADKSTYCSFTSNSVYNGVACTYYALTDKNYFSNLPR